MFNAVFNHLIDHYGANANYLMGRLTAPEIEEFYFTNDVPGAISRKHDLKWAIMKKRL